MSAPNVCATCRKALPDDTRSVCTTCFLPDEDVVEIVVVPGVWETKCRREELPMWHRHVLGQLRDKTNLLHAVTNLCATHEAEIDRLRAACRQIVAGWGHQDGVSKAVEMAREALGDV